MKIPRRSDRKIEAYQQELIKTHFAEVDNMYRKMRGWRHDYRNHIQVLKTYADKGDLQAITAYLEDLETDLCTVDTVFKTGNPMTDAILNSKISLANDRGIRVEADAHVPALLNFSPVDLCTILGNLFDNAIEASQCLPQEERLITVKAGRIRDILVMSVENNALPETIDPERTTKEDAFAHGFGIPNIRKAVERYGGQCSVRAEEGRFVLKIMIPMP